MKYRLHGDAVAPVQLPVLGFSIWKVQSHQPQRVHKLAASETAKQLLRDFLSVEQVRKGFALWVN